MNTWPLEEDRQGFTGFLKDLSLAQLGLVLDIACDGINREAEQRSNEERFGQHLETLQEQLHNATILPSRAIRRPRFLMRLGYFQSAVGLVCLIAGVIVPVLLGSTIVVSLPLFIGLLQLAGGPLAVSAQRSNMQERLKDVEYLERLYSRTERARADLEQTRHPPDHKVSCVTQRLLVNEELDTRLTNGDVEATNVRDSLRASNEVTPTNEAILRQAIINSASYPATPLEVFRHVSGLQL